MAKHNDLSGQRFGMLVSLSYMGNNKGRSAMWMCLCDCGKNKSINATSLRKGHTKSCGCLRNRPYRFTHLKSGTLTYQVWKSMKQRCMNPKNKGYEDYGGRGIKVCERWHSYELFLEDMGEKPKRLSIERIDNDGDYCKENCRWATYQDQAKNKRNTVMLTVDWVSKSAIEWSRIAGIGTSLIYRRLKDGWSVSNSIFVPAKRMSGKLTRVLSKVDGELVCTPRKGKK